jgi:GT2 family glycosyltransferase
MKFHFIIPSRNGAEYLDWCYASIRKHQGNHDVRITVLDDISDQDNTEQWCAEIARVDRKFNYVVNKGTIRHGISGGYKLLSSSVTDDEVICHFHNDMYLTPNALDGVERALKENPKSAISLTRIEPLMGYAPGPEKIIWNKAPLEVSEWNENDFLNDLNKLKDNWGGKVTSGHFAPFFMFKPVYDSIGGVDNVIFPLQSREDSDFAYRLILNGIKTIQIPYFVFHFASRGNRRNKYETNVLVDNPTWVEHNYKATRNFIRKWHTLNLHDEYLTPKLVTRFLTKFKVISPSYEELHNIEPYCDAIEIIGNPTIGNLYINQEQKTTMFDLNKKFNGLKDMDFSIILEIDCVPKLEHSIYQFIHNLPEIISESMQNSSIDFKTFKPMRNLVVNTYKIIDVASDLILDKNKLIEGVIL